MALESSAWKWLGGFSTGGTVRQVAVNAPDVVRLPAEIGKAKAKFGLASSSRVMRGYEAGRDGQRTRHSNRISLLLIAQGIALKLSPDFEQRLEPLRRWDGEPLGADPRKALRRAWRRYQLVVAQMHEPELQQSIHLRSQSDEDAGLRKLIQPRRLKGIGAQAGGDLVALRRSGRIARSCLAQACLKGDRPRIEQVDVR